MVTTVVAAETAEHSREQTEGIYVVETVTIRPKYVYSLMKRCLDFIFAVFGLVVCAIPMAVIMLAIKMDSRGSVIFCQERLGLNGKPFMMYKFRSMYMDAEKNGPQWARENDDRCTRVGAFLRKTRLDELPQLMNIIRGDMSLVGPRPERAVFYEEFETYIIGFRQRLQVVPGLTGYAQVNGGYDLKPEEKILYDMEYIKRRSLWMDFCCILKTVKIVFTHKGAR